MAARGKNRVYKYNWRIHEMTPKEYEEYLNFQKFLENYIKEMKKTRKKGRLQNGRLPNVKKQYRRQVIKKNKPCNFSTKKRS